MAVVAHFNPRQAAVPAICHHKVVSQRINHEPDDAVVGRRRRAGGGGGRGGAPLRQVHPCEQEAVDEESQRGDVQDKQE